VKEKIKEVMKMQGMMKDYVRSIKEREEIGEKERIIQQEYNSYMKCY